MCAGERDTSVDTCFQTMLSMLRLWFIQAGNLQTGVVGRLLFMLGGLGGPGSLLDGGDGGRDLPVHSLCILTFLFVLFFY